MKVSCSAELKAIQGNVLTLGCSFSSTSRVSSLTSVEWSYRPPDGQPMQSVFHFFSKSYPPTEGQFKGRIKWNGDIAGGDASLQLLNASLNDNGTFTCAVRNPPQDVHGSPCQMELRVTPRELSLRFSYVAVLMALILLPSAVITLVLLGRMCCCQRDTTLPQGYHSPIEVIEGEEHDHMMHKVKHRKFFCCEMHLQDFDDENYYNSSEELQKEAIAESRC
ncbi:myelin protein zero-like protein 3 isoform X2 [Scleropages formosus]|nr:myelin protein zero-like protein 3 isoform X2 [Scleropages formosus]